MAVSRCSFGLHRWVVARDRADAGESFVECRYCHRRRSSGLALSLTVFTAWAVGAVAVWWFASPLLGAVLMMGAVMGLGWTMGPAILGRLAEWLSIGR